MRQFQRENPESLLATAARENSKSPIQRPSGRGDTSWLCLIFLGFEASEGTARCGKQTFSLVDKARPCVVNAFIGVSLAEMLMLSRQQGKGPGRETGPTLTGECSESNSFILQTVKETSALFRQISGLNSILLRRHL